MLFLQALKWIKNIHLSAEIINKGIVSPVQSHPDPQRLFLLLLLMAPVLEKQTAEHKNNSYEQYCNK